MLPGVNWMLDGLEGQAACQGILHVKLPRVNWMADGLEDQWLETWEVPSLMVQATGEHLDLVVTLPIGEDHWTTPG
jgi:hypothetical protein